jgi:3-oxoacyl-[acyl-carrier protein] reductase
MDLNMISRVALVCGASQGIGLAIAREFASEGANVIICSRDRQRIELAAEQIKIATGKKVFPFVADLTRTDNIDALVTSIKRIHPGVDILINNSGGPLPGQFLNFTQDDWQAAYQLTFASANYLTKQLLPGMIEKKWGRIINLTSVTVKQPIDNLIFSNAMRLALVGWAKTLANQYGKSGITVNNIATGRIQTERLTQLAAHNARTQGTTSEMIFDDWTANIPVARIGSPEEIAWLTLFLASDKAGFITGTTISVDGGENKGIF